MAIDLQHQTAEEFALRFWHKLQDAYVSGDKLTYHRMIWWLWSKIVAGDITSAQARTTFNTAFNRSLDVTQWNNLVNTRFIPIKDRYLAFLAEGAL